MSTLIENYYHRGEGYNPFIIRDGWQVAQLNYTKEQDPANIEKIDKHLLTDEVFMLINGNAVLIAIDTRNDELVFECTRMEPGITYNIPVNTWHNIALEKNASVIIVERSNTHFGDFEYRALTAEEKTRLGRQITKALND